MDGTAEGLLASRRIFDEVRVGVRLGGRVRARVRVKVRVRVRVRARVRVKVRVRLAVHFGRGVVVLPRRSRASTERWAPLSEGARRAAATRRALARPSKATATRRRSYLRGTHPYPYPCPFPYPYPYP